MHGDADVVGGSWAGESDQVFQSCPLGTRWVHLVMGSACSSAKTGSDMSKPVSIEPLPMPTPSPSQREGS